MVDRTARTCLCPISHDRGCRLLDDVERSASAKLEDDHAPVVVPSFDLHCHGGLEHFLIKGDDPVEVGGDRGDMIESGGYRHPMSLMKSWVAPKTERFSMA